MGWAGVHGNSLGGPSGLRFLGQWEAWGRGGGLGGHRLLQTITADEEANWSGLVRKSSHKSSWPTWATYSAPEYGRAPSSPIQEPTFLPQSRSFSGCPLSAPSYWGSCQLPTPEVQDQCILATSACPAAPPASSLPAQPVPPKQQKPGLESVKSGYTALLPEIPHGLPIALIKSKSLHSKRPCQPQSSPLTPTLPTLLFIWILRSTHRALLVTTLAPPRLFELALCLDCSTPMSLSPP